jgi:hypothetical protein
VLASAVVFVVSSAEAQRRRRPPPPPPPAELSVTTMPGAPSPWIRVVTVRATAPLDLAADRRFLHLEFTPAGSRRPIRCDHPDRPARASDERVRQLEPGEAWREWIDLREYCWGRSLAALRAGADVTATFEPRGRRSFVVRAGGVEHHSLGPAHFGVAAQPAPAEPDPTAPVRVVLSDADAASAERFVLRVGALGREGTRRAYVRADRFSFRVRGPEGEAECSVPHGGGAVQPDLYQRLRPGSGARFALEGHRFCRGMLRSAGVYEIVPHLLLEEDGAAYDLDAITGTFTGAPALLRIRRGERGYVERPVAPGGGPS